MSVSALAQPATDKILDLEPRASRAPDETHAGLVTSLRSFRAPFAFRGRMRTVRQLRQGSRPNAWEAAWVVWDYRDADHFYYFILKLNGWELGKRDPLYKGGQRFLATGPTPTLRLGAWNRFEVRKRDTTMAVFVDGVSVTTFRDLERPFRGGRVGFYTEDAKVQFDDIRAPLADNFDSHRTGTYNDGAVFGRWKTEFAGYGAVRIMAVTRRLARRARDDG